MSSTIEINKICEFCGKEFIDNKTSTRYCSQPSSGLSYKAAKRATHVRDQNQRTSGLKITDKLIFMALKTFDQSEIKASFDASKKYEELKTLISLMEGYLSCLKILIKEFPVHVETLSLKSKELNQTISQFSSSFFNEYLSKFKKEIHSEILEATKIASRQFNEQTSKTLQRANQDNKITLSTTFFYIILITLGFMSIIIGMLFYCNSLDLLPPPLKSLFLPTIGIWALSIISFVGIRIYFYKK